MSKRNCLIPVSVLLCILFFNLSLDAKRIYHESENAIIKTDLEHPAFDNLLFSQEGLPEDSNLSIAGNKTRTSVETMFMGTSEVIISVVWPRYSEDNRADIFDPSGTLIVSICDPSECYTGSGNDGSYTNTSVYSNCLADGTGYYAVLYDAFNDGWNGSSNITITSGGASVLSNDGSGTGTGGTTINFDVSGGGGSCIPTSILSCAAAGNEISGKVFEDFNYNGINESGEEAGVESVTVTVTDSLGNSFTDNTDSAGDYAITGLTSGYTYRVEFTNIPAWASPTFYGDDNATLVQFIKPGNCANLGVSSPGDYCQSNPKIVTTCFVDGAPLGGGTSGLGDVIVAYPFTSSGTNNASNEYLAINSQTGTVWGIAYQKKESSLYAAAMMKRHAGFGTLGIGGIYKVDYSNPASPVVSNWLDVNTISNVGTNPRNYTLPATAGTSSADSLAFDAVGKIGIGDIDLSSNEDTLYVLNLNNNGSLLKIDVATKTLISTTNIGNPGCGNAGDVRPWALEIYKDKVYVGLVCSGENAGAGDLQFFVQRLDGTSWTTVLNSTLQYTKGIVHTAFPAICNDWETWTTYFSGIHEAGASAAGPRWCRPQAMLSDMEFDSDGSLYLGFMDRTGHQTGYLQSNNSGTGLGNGYIGGDLLKAYNNNGILTMESNGSAGTAGCGVGNGQGPGGGEFFCGENFSTDNDNNGTVEEIHQETSLGGIGILAGKDVLSVNVMDPINVFSGGTSWMDVTDGSIDYAYQVFNSAATGGGQEVGTFGKAAGLGDLELICFPAPIEIGNYVWLDSDSDGVQDAGELGIEGIRMELYDDSGNLLAIDTTDMLGYYFFSGNGIDGASWQTSNDTLQENTSYYIVAGGNGQFSSGEIILSGTPYELTQDSTNSGMNRYEIDSDGTIAAGVDSDFDGEPYVQITTGGIGETDHSFDFGFRPVGTCSEITEVITTRRICHGENVDSLAALTTFGNPDSIAFVYFASAQTDSSVIYSGGTGIDTVQILNGNDTVRITDIAGFMNTGATPDTFYIYAIVQPAPNENTCRPYEEILVIVNPNPVLTPSSTAETCMDGSGTATVTPSGGAGSYNYLWSNGGTIQTISGLNAGMYDVTVTDAAGCEAIATGITVTNVCTDFDLALKKTVVTSGTYEPGTDVDFEIKVYNQGQLNAVNVVVKDYIPSGLRLNDSNWDTIGTTDVAVDTIPLVEAGDSVTLMITLRINSGFQSASGQLINNAEITSADGGIDSDSPLSMTNNGTTNELATDNDTDDEAANTPGTSDNPADEDDYDAALIIVNCPPLECLPINVKQSGKE